MKAARVLKAMRIVFEGSRHSQQRLNVWVPLMRLVHSDLTEAGAADRLRPVVEADPVAARYTLTAMTRENAEGGGYITDRAIRILDCAMGLAPPPPLSTERRELFELERRLGAKPIREAFAELAADLPELLGLETAAQASDALTATPDARWLEISERCAQLLGPEGGAADLVLRSRVALTIALRYLAAVHGRKPKKILDEPLLDRAGGDEMQ